MEKKLFFRAWTGSESGAWSTLMGESEARGMVDLTMERIGWKDKPLKKFRVERHTEDGDIKLWMWGEDEAGFQDESVTHVGTLVEIDGKVVFNDMAPSKDSDPEDHEDCLFCAYQHQGK